MATSAQHPAGERLLDAIDEGAVDTVILAFPDHYGRLMGKRVDAGFFAQSPADGTHACDYLLTVDIDMEPLEGFAFANWETGYGDLHLLPDMATARVLSWLDRTGFVMCDAVDHHGEPIGVAPRSILRRQVAAAAEAGFSVQAASELEFFLYRTSFRDAAAGGYRELEPAGWYIEDYNLLQGSRTEDVNGAFRRHLAASGVPVESTKGEFGKGQHELNIRYCDVLEMADRHVLMKQACKEIADQQGAAVTFMAKPDAVEAGSSSHLHLSLWHGTPQPGTPQPGSSGSHVDVAHPQTNAEAQNAFSGPLSLHGIECSDEFRWFLGGWMTYAPELMAWMAPTINSYKRYQSQSWAPTVLAWSPDNRTASFRVVGEGPSLRIECRLPGADVNPYLAYSVAIAAGLLGIRERIEPPPAHLGDVYSVTDQPTVPTTLAEAAERLAASSFAREVFGDDVVDHYVHFFRHEVRAFHAAVTDWERIRYFERI